MAISISGPSTQIPTNVVEIGNEISQNAINAISAASLPSTGNPFTTTSSATSIANVLVSNKQSTPDASWGFPFSVPSNFPLGLLNGSWVPLASNSAVVGSYFGNASDIWENYNFDFTDDQGNYVTLNGSAKVGDDNVDVYYSQGDFTGNIQYNTQSVYLEANGPNYGSGSWDNYVGYAEWYDSSNNLWYRYVYLNGSNSFYTADNQYNPPQ